MLEKQNTPVITPIFSPEKIKELTQLMEDQVNEVMRLQDEGELPCASIMPRCHVERKDVMEILKKKSAQATRIMANVRKKRNLKRGQLISVEDFCIATGLPERIVQRALDMCPMMHFLGHKPPHLQNKPPYKKDKDSDGD